MSMRLHNVFLCGKRDLSSHASIGFQTGKSEAQGILSLITLL